MSLFVVIVNRALWRRLYKLADRRLRIGLIGEEPMGAVQQRQRGPTPAEGTPLVSVEHVRHFYKRGASSNLLVLDDVDLTMYDNEIVALLGRSGSGKSTLLRIVSGLMPPSSGEVCIDGQPVKGPADGLAMVFQTFALFPWLTVQENVELGLEAQGVAPEERRKRALAAIDLIGLDGFETAYPKELSGGMRQRVGLARALVVNPKLLLDGRAVLGARRAHRRNAAHRPSRPLVRRPHADPRHSDGHAQYRGGGAHERPHPGVLVQSRPRHRRDQG